LTFHLDIQCFIDYATPAHQNYQNIALMSVEIILIFIQSIRYFSITI
jgi:hypothetical protein